MAASVTVVKFEEINLKFEKVQDAIKFKKIRDPDSITIVIRRHSVVHKVQANDKVQKVRTSQLLSPYHCQLGLCEYMASALMLSCVCIDRYVECIDHIFCITSVCKHRSNCVCVCVCVCDTFCH